MLADKKRQIMEDMKKSSTISKDQVQPSNIPSIISVEQSKVKTKRVYKVDDKEEWLS